MSYSRRWRAYFFGKISVKVLHTPGHTMESCYLLKNEEGKSRTIFTGDTLFIGDVGRPDLAKNLPKYLKKIWLDYYLILSKTKYTLWMMCYCLSSSWSRKCMWKKFIQRNYKYYWRTKRTNYALRDGLTKNEFINELTDGILPPPGYFGVNVNMNKNGYDSIQEVMHRSLTPLSIYSFKNLNQKELLF